MFELADCVFQKVQGKVQILVATDLGESYEYSADNLFYVFVNLNNGQKHPDFFIVPSKIVAEYIKKSHKNWLGTPGKGGKKHKDTPMRKFDDPGEVYLNRWDLLDL